MKKPRWVPRRVWNHSFSIVLGAAYVVLRIIAWLTAETNEFASQWAAGHSDDVLGALVVVLALKVFREKGAPEDKGHD